MAIDQEMHKWIENYSIGDNLYRLRIRSMSQLINTKIKDWNFESEHKVSVMRLKRRHPNKLHRIPQFVEMPGLDTEMRYHDIITVKGEPEDVDKLVIKFHLGVIPLKPESDMLKKEYRNWLNSLSKKFAA